MTGVPVVETHHGLEVSYCGRGYDTRDGYRVIGGCAQVWHSKAEAARAARIAGPAFSAQPAHTALARRLWVLHDDHGGGFLTPAGADDARRDYFQALKAWGYPLSEVEELLVDGTEVDAAPDDEDEPVDVDPEHDDEDLDDELLDDPDRPITDVHLPDDDPDA